MKYFFEKCRILGIYSFEKYLSNVVEITRILKYKEIIKNIDEMKNILIESCKNDYELLYILDNDKIVLLKNNKIRLIK